jgi:cation:H+ antiporter
MLMDFLFTVLGLGILVIGGELTLRGAIGLAKLLGVSTAMIGLTVVAFGTSAPELVVSLEAVIDGAPDIAIGNVVGSNIANILLVLGVGALIAPLICDPGSVRRDGTAMMVAMAFLVGLGLLGAIQAWQGVLMLIALIAYVTWSYRLDQRNGAATAVADLHEREVEETTGVPTATWLVLLYVLIGLAALIGGAKLLVDGAIGVARAAGISESVIGLSLVAVGTSLPELAATAIAAWRRHTDVAVGNVLGSNLFNVLLILGTTSMVGPMPFADEFVRVDLWVMMGAGVVLIPVMVTNWSISRREGALLLLLYAVYITSMGLGWGRAVPAI